jgi:hypothetical protein
MELDIVLQEYTKVESKELLRVQELHRRAHGNRTRVTITDFLAAVPEPLWRGVLEASLEAEGCARFAQGRLQLP